jgi:putative transposase
VHQKLKQWLGCCRATYNKALAHIKEGKRHEKSFYWLRNRFVNECNVPDSQKYLLDCPKHVREGAMKDLSEAFSTNFKIRKKNPRHVFDIRFRCKRDSHSIVIPKTAITPCDTGLRIYPKMLSPDPVGLMHPEKMPKPSSDCRLSQDRMGRWVLFVSTEVQTFATAGENQTGRVCSIDPGVRTFASTWSPDGEAFKLGDGDATRAYELLIRTDKLVSSCAKASGRSRYRKKKVLARLRHRVENVQKDMHYQIANFLVTKYDKIILPVFGSKRMSAKMGRRLTTKTVRSMLGLGHYAFRQRLKDVAERLGKSVLECTEEYTSKTCSRCGHIHQTLGSAKTFKCAECGLVVDRDLQGAFNIFLKYAKEHPEFARGEGLQR